MTTKLPASAIHSKQRARSTDSFTLRPPLTAARVRHCIFPSVACAPTNPPFNPRQLAHHVLRVQLVLRGRQQRPTWTAAVWPATATTAAIWTAGRLSGRTWTPADRLWRRSNAAAIHWLPWPAARVRAAAATTSATAIHGLSGTAEPIPAAGSSATAAIPDWSRTAATATARATPTAAAHGHDLGADGGLVQRELVRPSPSPRQVEQDPKHTALLHHGTGPSQV
jgi:hypothetical protein